MTGSGTAGHAGHVEGACALVATALSEGRRQGVRLVSGPRRAFALSSGRTLVHVPYPGITPEWDQRTATCGVALQCSPSKDRLADYPLHLLPSRQLQALILVEGEVALGWVARRWPGLVSDLERRVPGMVFGDADRNAADMLDRAQALALSATELTCPPLLGRLHVDSAAERHLRSALRRVLGRMPWSSRRPLSQTLHSIPVGGQGGAPNANLPPPSRPDDEDPEIRVDERPGIPYPEWNAWTGRFLRDHVAVLERRQVTASRSTAPTTADLRRWFEEHTQRAITGRLEDGSDLDIDRYVDYYVDTVAGTATAPRVFRDLLPVARDVTTALLLDGSSSLGVNQGRVFRLELACADALCRAMALAKERHGLFVFSGNTRHRVDVACLKDFDDRHVVVPSTEGLTVGGYTRLGAPLRHLTNRLLAQPSHRRLLIVIGDGLMSDEGYEGRYAWADVAHALDEASEAGVSVYYIGVGSCRVDPLPEVFGPRRSQRVRRVEELPRLLAHVHRELVAA